MGFIEIGGGLSQLRLLPWMTHVVVPHAACPGRDKCGLGSLWDPETQIWDMKFLTQLQLSIQSTGRYTIYPPNARSLSHYYLTSDRLSLLLNTNSLNNKLLTSKLQIFRYEICDILQISSIP